MPQGNGRMHIFLETPMCMPIGPNAHFSFHIAPDKGCVGMK